MYGKSKTSSKFCIPETGYWIAKSRILEENLLLKIHVGGPNYHRRKVPNLGASNRNESFVNSALCIIQDGGILNSAWGLFSKEKNQQKRDMEETFVTKMFLLAHFKQARRYLFVEWRIALSFTFCLLAFCDGNFTFINSVEAPLSCLSSPTDTERQKLNLSLKDSRSQQ